MTSEMPREIFCSQFSDKQGGIYNVNKFVGEPPVKYIRVDIVEKLDDQRLDKIKTFLKMRYGRDLTDVHKDMEFLVDMLEKPDDKEVREAIALLNKWPKVEWFKGRVVLQRAIETLIRAATAKCEKCKCNE